MIVRTHSVRTALNAVQIVVTIVMTARTTCWTVMMNVVRVICCRVHVIELIVASILKRLQST